MIRAPGPLDLAARGVNLLRDPRALKDEELVLSQNAVPTLLGKLSKRQNRQFVGPFPGNSLDKTPISFAISPLGVSGSQFVLCSSLRTPTYSDSTYVQVGDFGGPVASRTGTLSVRPLVAVFNKTSIVFLGASGGAPGAASQAGMFLVSTVNDAPNISDFVFQDSTNSNLVPRGGAPYRSRMVYWNFGKGFESTLIFSDNFKADLIGVDALHSRALTVGGARSGDRIVACKEIMLTAVGSPSQSALLVLFEYSAFIITGEPNQTTDNQSSTPLFGNVTVSQISFNCGCSAPETIATTPYGTFWAGPDDVWFFQFGAGTPVRVGTKIRPALARTPAALRYKWTAAYFNGFYRLTAAGEDQNVSAYEALSDQWWLDLRAGPPVGDPGGAEPQEQAMWWGPMQYQGYDSQGNQAATSGLFALDAFPDRDQHLYGIEVNLVDNAYRTFRYDSDDLGHDIPVPSDYGPILHLTGLEIQMDIRTKEFDFGDSMIAKRCDGLELNLWNSDTARMAVDIILDAGREVDTSVKDIIQTGFVGGVDNADTGPNLSRQTQAVAMYPNPAKRDIGQTMQFRIYDIPGYVVTDDDQSFCFVSEDFPTPTPAVGHIAILNKGFYATVVDFVNELIRAMNAATTPGRFSANWTISTVNPNLAITDSLFQWFIVFQPTGGGLVPPPPNPLPGTPDQQRQTRKIGTLLGFDTTVNQDYNNVQRTGDGETVNPGTSAWMKMSANWNFGGFAVRIAPINRRPT